MTKPKKWHMDLEDGDVILKYNKTTPISRTSNSSMALGPVQSVCVYDFSQSLVSTRGKATIPKEKALKFSCMNGKIVLSLTYHEWNAGDFSLKFSGITDSTAFVQKWKEVISYSEKPVEETSLSLSEQSTHANQSSATNSSFTTVHNDEHQPPAKKPRTSKALDIDEDIESKKIGLMELPVCALQIPPRGYRLLRDPDPTFVNSLKDNMLKDPAGPGAAPLALLCIDMNSPDEFNERYKSVYRYEVLGGLHTYLAKSQLAQEIKNNEFFKVVNAEVYVGLSDDEALRLASRHNLNSHFHHKVTHRDMIETCRARLYVMAKKDFDKDPTPLPNSAWRESCKNYIIPSSISNTHCDSILHQSTLPKAVWDLAVNVMDLYEKGSLKDQKLKVKQLTSKPEFKQQYFTPLRALPEEEQCKILQKVVERKVTLNGVKDLAKKAKQINTLKTLFSRLTNTSSWFEAQSRYPVHATEEKLNKYIECDLKGNVPKAFQDFCQRVVSNATASATANEHIFVHSPSEGEHSSMAAVVVSDYCDVSGVAIKAIHPQYSGADLAMVEVTSEMTKEDKIRNIIYAIKEVNAANGKPIFNIVLLVEPDNLSHVQTIMKAHFSGLVCEYFFFAQKTEVKKGNCCLTNCVTVAVIAHHSADGQVLPEHF